MQNNRVRQGCILGPLVFAIIMNNIAKEINEGKRGTVGYRTLRPVEMSELLYADDLIIFANHKRESKDRMERWSEQPEKYNQRLYPQGSQKQ